MFKKTVGKVQDRSVYEGQLPDGLFEKCDHCGSIVFHEDIIENNYICPGCDHYFRISARNRISMMLDKDSFEEWNSVMKPSNPLQFPGYDKKLAVVKEATNLDEAVVTGMGKMGGTSVAIAVMASDFLMGSMGYVVGEKITDLVEEATKRRLPLIIVCCSGGARMQEGIVSLMQMAKTAQALKKHDEAGLLYISILTDPTTGGVMASFAMLADIILAEPRALIGFAGPRVIEQTIRQKLPEGFQKSEFLLEHGFIDRIVKRGKLKQVVSSLIRIETGGERC